MASFKSRQWMPIAVPLLAGVVLAVALAVAPPALATPSYADATGQRCAACHVGPPGQAVLTAEGQRFAAIASHRTDPAGAWKIVVGSGAAAAPVQMPSQLPRTGDGLASTDTRWALAIGLALIIVGGTLTAGSRRRLGRG